MIMTNFNEHIDHQKQSTSALPIQIAGTHHVNLQDRSGKTLLVHNCAKGLASTVEELALDENIDVNLADNEGNTALHHAAQAGHTNVVQILLKRFPLLQIDQVNKLGQTALIKAAIQGRVNCAKFLLNAGADPYLRDYGRQFCALEWAEYVGRTECAHMIAHFMLGSSRRPNSSCGSPAQLNNRKRNGISKNAQNSHQQKYKHNLNGPDIFDDSVPIKKLSDSACINFKQVACLAAIPVIGSVVNGELPVVVRPRVRSAPPIPTFKITTPQRTYEKPTNNNNNKKILKKNGLNRAPLMATVVAHCRVRPSSSCA